MKKETIVQFVCFETSVAFDAFIQHWEHYVKKFDTKQVKTNLLQQMAAKNKYKYVSQHVWPEDDFQFTFTKEKPAVTFPETKIRVVQAGGYKPMQIECSHDEDKNAIKILLFLNKAVYDIAPFIALESYVYLNIYEAYYESCTYSYILEFFVEEADVEELSLQLKNEPRHSEIGIYTECLVPQL